MADDSGNWIGDLVRQLIFVGFYVSMPCSQKVCKHVQIQQHQHGTYLAPIPLMNFNMGALKWSPFIMFFPTLVFGRVLHKKIRWWMMMRDDDDDDDYDDDDEW